MIRGPTVIKIGNAPSGGSGFTCCCCFKCCTCLNLQFLRTDIGMIKLAELILGFFCQSLALNFGSAYSSSMGSAYYGFITTASWSCMTVFLLLFCYIFSEKSVYLMRQSLFETSFNILASCGYLSSCSVLGFIVNTVLYPLYMVTPFFQVFPAMTSTYILGIILGLIHAYDAYKSFKFLQGYR
ncbi:protein singles bar [Onthophagus taurus]|uniref:protein singles bar n=1 Tax=Onthophagus taurus TaxID=166361 RepID=UPI000C205753|nr:protein singles bar [Onthophagus taurus]